MPIAIDVAQRDCGFVPALAVELHRERRRGPRPRAVGGEREDAQTLALEDIEFVGRLCPYHQHRHAVDFERPALFHRFRTGQSCPELLRRERFRAGVDPETAQAGAPDRLGAGEVSLSSRRPHRGHRRAREPQPGRRPRHGERQWRLPTYLQGVLQGAR